MMDALLRAYLDSIDWASSTSDGYRRGPRTAEAIPALIEAVWAADDGDIQPDGNLFYYMSDGVPEFAPQVVCVLLAMLASPLTDWKRGRVLGVIDGVLHAGYDAVNDHPECRSADWFKAQLSQAAEGLWLYYELLRLPDSADRQNALHLAAVSDTDRRRVRAYAAGLLATEQDAGVRELAQGIVEGDIDDALDLQVWLGPGSDRDR